MSKVRKRNKVRKENYEDIVMRHNMRKRRRRRTSKIRLTMLLFVLLTAGMLSLMFLTPLFNVKGISVYGNNKVQSDLIISQSGIELGENLFKVNIRQVKKNLSSIAYLNDFQIKRMLYPPSVRITVTECTVSAYAKVNSSYIAIDKNCKVLEELSEPAAGVPEIVGLSLQKYSIGSKLEIDESDKFDIILLCIDEMTNRGLIQRVNRISVENTTDIFFRYDDRLNVLCGSVLDLDKKLRLFDEIIRGNRLTDNSRGTVDLSVSGKAVYTP
ncbi:MAG: FtsQ-type POTRA domain-containing protein [Clostridia bacterium]|nr:FtsQ-type POTRA domain-containing protein [Clostridia bacterium]